MDSIDLNQRKELAALVRKFLEEDITAFDFDEQLDQFTDSSDSVVVFVAEVVWCFYDDCDNHFVVLSKADWDYFQRLLLLLESDCDVRSESFRCWSMTQIVAFVTLLGFLYLALLFGWGDQLYVVAIPFGFISILISWFRSRIYQPGPYDLIMEPFSSIADLKTIYDSVGFRKKLYPRRLRERRIRSPFMNLIYCIPVYMAWLIGSPIVLVIQMFPLTVRQTRVIVS